MLLVMPPLFKFLLLAPALLLATTASAKPAQEFVSKLPTPVSATMPTRVLDIATYRIAPAPGAPQLLVHLWCAPRRNPDGGGMFGAPPGYYTGEITREEVSSSGSLRPSPFVYDIFTPDGKGGWNYHSSIFHEDISTPYAPTVRYLNNQTKSDYIFEIDGFHDSAVFSRTIYVFTNWDFPDSERIFKRDVSDLLMPHALAGAVHYGFGRDARGYAQLIKSERGFDNATKRSFDTRTISNWDEDALDWKEGLPQRVQK